MQMYKDPKSPLGYELRDNGIDSYGVNHNGFSTRDELEYQMARQNREQQLIQNYNNQGITENYPQYGTNFWGNSGNNYGFGNSDISGNVQTVTNRLNGTDYSVLPDYTIGSASGYNNQANYGTTDYTINTESLIGKPSSYFQNDNYATIQPQNWESAAEGQKVYNNVVRQEGNFTPSDQNIFDYAKSAIQGGINLVSNFSNMRKMKVTDKYKHAMMNCNAAQYGQGGADIATLASNLREWNDKRTGSNTLDSSEGDQYANKIGRLLGGKYPNGDCDELIQRYIKKNW